MRLTLVLNFEAAIGHIGVFAYYKCKLALTISPGTNIHTPSARGRPRTLASNWPCQSKERTLPT